MAKGDSGCTKTSAECADSDIISADERSKSIKSVDVKSALLRITETIEPTVTLMGYEVVDVEFSKRSEGLSLTFFIDVVGGVSLDDCEKVHRAIDPLLDELNPTGNEPYTLNVSSPGLDRPFVKQRDFERNYGKAVELKLYAPYRGKKLFEGILKERGENFVIITEGGQDVKFESSKIALVRPAVKFE